MMIDPATLARRREEIYAASFAPTTENRRIGAEVELLALDEQTLFPVPLLDGKRGLVARIAEFGAVNGWRELPGYGRAPKFVIPGKGLISFEPGGQVEFSSDAQPSVSALVRILESVVTPLRAALYESGVRLESIGIDPINDARDVPLQLDIERYETMTRYFDLRGPFGVRMMRQTAAIQISLDRGSVPATRWRLLNDLAPFVTAIFANSPAYLGEDSGHRSFRAHCWRSLDATRTGVAASDADPALEYARFALEANDMSRSLEIDAPFAVSDRSGDEAAWQTHLTTLFPEIRPRGHFEVRSCDAIDPTYYAAPLVFLSGIAYDETSSKEAAVLAGESRALLRTAGERALRDQSIARTARDLFDLAIAGAERLGGSFVDGKALEIARGFVAEYTARDRSPADDRETERRLPRASTPALTK